MLIVHVDILVKPEAVSEFIEATLKNAKASLQEPGVLRFDFIRDNQDPNRFCLVEVYKDDKAPAAHKETKHYNTWRDRVEPMMAKARSSRKFSAIFPDADGWASQ